jgi:adenosylcobyric acid synthase
MAGGTPAGDARTILVAGTASHVGKSTVAAGLCRHLADRGVDVVPFKAQNMSNNARAVPAPDGSWGEIGVSQYVQGRAARVSPTTDCNPVLLKPRGGGESQLVVHGEAVGHYDAGTYYDEHWEVAREAVRTAYGRLAAAHDVVVAEGAGSAAEINLHDRDLANVETARLADAEVVLVGDIERGGVFAALYGTLELLPADLRERVVGAVVTKFRGDPSLLDAGVAEFERLTGVDVLDVLPYDDPGLPAEDSLSLPAADETAVRGTGDGVPEAASAAVGVPRFPRASNVTDLEPLARAPGVRVAYRPLDAGLGDVDAVVLPGTKNTVDDLQALRRAGLDAELRAFDGPVLGICGGYQMLGERLTGAAVEGTGDADVVPGVGLLPVETAFTREKRVRVTTVDVAGCGPLAGADGTAAGYEIHAGETTTLPGAAVDRPLGPRSAAVGDVLGTYLHGLFENAALRDAFLDSVFEHAGIDRPGAETPARSPYDRAAALVDDLARVLA